LALRLINILYAFLSPLVRAKNPCFLFLLRCDGWYSIPNVRHRTCCRRGNEIAGRVMQRNGEVLERDSVLKLADRDGRGRAGVAMIRALVLARAKMDASGNRGMFVLLLPGLYVAAAVYE
jgi:hypothetical protein